MRAIAAVILIVGLALGGYYVFTEDPGAAGGAGTGGGAETLSNGSTSDGSGGQNRGPSAGDSAWQPELPLTPSKSEPSLSKKARDMAKFEPTEEERRLWTLLRPSCESLVEDPDHIGPCPPRELGGHSARVVRKYREPDTSFMVWVHEDGARTTLQPSFYERNASTGELEPQTRMITTYVPTETMPIDPTGTAVGNSAKNGNGKK